MSFLEGFDTTNKTVEEAIRLFKETYGSAMTPLKASTIINGENIKINDNNQLIDDCEYDDPNFAQKEKWITKKLYPYQKKALFKILEFDKYSPDSIKSINEIKRFYSRRFCKKCFSCFLLWIFCHQLNSRHSFK